MKNMFIFPNTLFEKNNLIDKNTTVYLIEHPVFFTEHQYHKLKLILHRATMKHYFDYIKKKYKCRVKYIEYNKYNLKLYKSIKGNRIDFHDPVDHLVIKDIKKLAKVAKKDIFIHNTPLFLHKVEELEEFAKGKNKFNHNSFYIWSRKKLNILVKNNKPKGGKWSFDTENRKPFPKNFKTNYIPKVKSNKYIVKAINYVKKNFGGIYRIF